MYYSSVFLITVVNCVLLFVAGVLTVGGNGGSEGPMTVWICGGLWLAAFTAASLVLVARGRSEAGLLTAVAAMPTAYAAVLAVLYASYAFGQIRPTSPELKAACKTAGVWFLSKPAQAVGSIAFDWSAKFPPQIDYLEFADDFRLSKIGSFNPEYPSQIAFTEKVKTEMQRDGTKSTTIFRISRTGERTPGPVLAADVLVSYKYLAGEEELWKVSSQQGLVGYEITVTDRRDARELAKLRYFTELARERACGPAGTKVLHIQAFVLTALGMQ